MLSRSLVKADAFTDSMVRHGRLNLVLLHQLRLVSTSTTSKTIQQQVVQRQKRATNLPPAPAVGAQQQQQIAGAKAREKTRARLDNIDLWHSIETIKKFGHRLAQLDPLQLRKPEQLRDVTWSSELVEKMRARTNIVPTLGFLDTKQPVMATNELIESVWNIYANNDCGLEFGHMSQEHEVEWLTSQWEKLNEMVHLDRSDQQNLAKLLLECETFDHFMAAKYPTLKRYGCEGAEPMLVVLDETLRLCHLGKEDHDELTETLGLIEDVIIGMPHRGRLNLLACLLGFDTRAIFQKARGEPELDLTRAWMAQGDVLSHLSTNTRFVYGLDRQNIGLSRDTPDPLNVTLLPNPSHLELAAPMTVGAARGRAHNMLHDYTSSPKFPTFSSDNYDPTIASIPTPTISQQQSLPYKGSSRLNGGIIGTEANNTNYEQYLRSILPIQIHGDASVAGQGIIQETLQMANLDQFTTAGSLHLVVNNQIGYTTPAERGRSSRHCTDIFKLIECPIIHVNGQNIGSVVRATRLALTYRQKFGKDVAINLICYRKHGHNELDEPSFTQPLMYSSIRARKSIPQSYCDEIGMSQTDRQQIVEQYKQKLQIEHKQSEHFKPDNDNYRNFELPTEYHRDHVCSWQTGCPLPMLRSIALDSVRVPEDFVVHSNIKRAVVDERTKKFSIDGESDIHDEKKLAQIPVDWATAEILAFGSLLKQNHSVRLAGQDVARGTFSTRHAILYDQNTERAHVPLNDMIRSSSATPTTTINSRNSTQQQVAPIKQRAQLEVANTVLSEEAALAYEFAYSAETCALTLWEAQFGDFFNTAQSVIDTLVSSSESKWLKQSPLTLLLPHGLDGAGPEHSSGHLERFLQMSSSAYDSIDTEAKVNWSVCFPTLPSQYFHLLRRQVLRPFRKPLIVMSPKVLFRHPGCLSELSHFGPKKSFESILDDPTLEAADKEKRCQQIDTVLLCSGKLYFTLHEQRLANKMQNVAIIRIEELCPFPIQSIIHKLTRYPRVGPTNYVWCQEEHKNQGAYNFVAERLENMANIKLRYIGRSESELPATGSGVLHKKQTEQLVKQFLDLKS